MDQDARDTAWSHNLRTPTLEVLDPCPSAAQSWRENMVREAAYFRFLHRGCGPGRALEDWAAAEREVDAFMFMPTG
jgi:hypothetical protein